MRVVNAILYVDDSVAAPAAGISVEIDGQPVLQRDDVPPADWIAVVEALGTSLNEDIRAQLSGPLTELVAGLEAEVETGRATQVAREQALADWQQATSSDAP